jgi:hypothetical protein
MVLAVLSGAAHADLVANGGFETETLSGVLPVLPIPSWTATGTGIAVDTAFPNTGTYDAGFSSGSADPSPGTLSQAIATTPGGSYALSFALLDQAGFSGDSFTVAFGAFTAVVTGDNAAAPGDLPSFYTAESFTIPAVDITAGSTALSFTGLHAPGIASVWSLDDISLVSLGPVPVPEPRSAAMFATLLAAGLALGGSRRTSRALS